MYLIPLSQLESVDLVVHALRAAGGAADCSVCPVRKVCMKQCLAVADGIARLLASNGLPSLGESPQEPEPPPPAPAPGEGRARLRVVK